MSFESFEKSKKKLEILKEDIREADIDTIDLVQENEELHAMLASVNKETIRDSKIMDCIIQSLESLLVQNKEKRKENDVILSSQNDLLNNMLNDVKEQKKEVEQQKKKLNRNMSLLKELEVWNINKSIDENEYKTKVLEEAILSTFQDITIISKKNSMGRQNIPDFGNTYPSGTSQLDTSWEIEESKEEVDIRMEALQEIIEGTKTIMEVSVEDNTKLEYAQESADVFSNAINIGLISSALIVEMIKKDKK